MSGPSPASSTAWSRCITTRARSRPSCAASTAASPSPRVSKPSSPRRRTALRSTSWARAWLRPARWKVRSVWRRNSYRSRSRRPPMHTDRRTLLQAAAALPLATVGTGAAFAQAPTATPAAAPPKEITRALAHYIVTASYDDLPANVRKEGVRTLLNWVGVAIGGSHHQTVDIAVAALAPFSGPQQASLFGRRERFDIMNAAFINGVSSHIFDYDDTHLKTIIHPAAPVVPAILAFAEYRCVSGSEFLNALILGVETECRIGNAVYPDHYDRGWHITGPCGVFGAAAAMGKLLGLTEQQMVWALGLAASQPVGLRESFGSMSKSFNPGRAAHNGMTAAVLAAAGFTSSDEMIEARRGWASTISTKQD